MIAEWSDVYAVQLDTPWVRAVVLVAGCGDPDRRNHHHLAAAARSDPSLLPLDMRLEENIAVVEPVRLDNPVLVDLQETSFIKDVQLYTRYLRSQWNGSALALIAGPLRVFLRRVLYPRRWAWTAVIPCPENWTSGPGRAYGSWRRGRTAGRASGTPVSR